MRRSLLILSFIEGGAVMCAELCGARLLAPVFGSSLYVWASVMGVTLGGLAAGYFAGGKAGPASQAATLRLILIAAAVYMMAMPFIGHAVLRHLTLLSFTPAVLAGTVLLLLPPVFCLGAASPLFIALQTASRDAAGNVSGTVYAVSTLGGIASTFLCGFILIPEAGLTVTLLSHGLILFAGTLLVLRGRWTGALLTALVAGSLSLSPGKTPGLVYAQDGIYGRLVVADLHEDEIPRRRLLLNGIIQTEIRKDDGASTMKYIRLLDSLLPGGGGARALVLGSGGGSAPNLLVKKGYEVTAVEFDKRILSASRKFFALDPDVRIVHDDARRFINTDDGRYAVVFVDVFKAEEQPSHVLTVESLHRLGTLLSAGGSLIINWHGYEEGNAGAGTRVLLATLDQAGYAARLHYTGHDPDYRNIMVVARLDAATGGKPSHMVNNDDRPLMEKYNAEANMRWRRNYIRYYQASLLHQ